MKNLHKFRIVKLLTKLKNKKYEFKNKIIKNSTLSNTKKKANKFKIEIRKNHLITTLEEINNDLKKEFVYIGLTKYNFFRLEKFIRRIRNKKNIITNFKVASKNYKVENALNRFIEYKKETNRILKKEKIKIIFHEEELVKILEVVQTQCNEHNQKDILRALGIVCNYQFIGPKFILIDITDHCNLNCIYCKGHSLFQIGKHEFWNKTKEMKLEDVIKILDDAKKLGVEEIYIVGGGEPTIYKEFDNVIREIKKRGFKMSFSTNGTLINKRLSNIITKYNVDSVTFSISAANSTTYTIIHPKQNKNKFDKLKSNMKLISNIRNKNDSRTRLIALFVITKNNFDEIINMVDFTKKAGFDEIRLQLLHQEEFSKILKISPKQEKKLKEEIFKAKIIAQKNNLSFQESISFQEKNLDKNGSWSKDYYKKNGCMVGWAFSFIRPNGETMFCCGMKMIDKIGKQSYKEIWESKEYNKIRKAAKEFNSEKNILCEDNQYIINDYCNKCDNYDINNELIKFLEQHQLKEFVER